jgi:protein disulfide-isomerase
MLTARGDIAMAQQIGVQGTVCFDNKYAVSGAQHVETFRKP